MAERTFAMIKPDAVSAGNTGNILAVIEEHGFQINRIQKVKLTDATAREFYAVHNKRSFFGEMIDFITSGPVVLLALERDDAVRAWRDLMGATNPAEAAQGTIRQLFGANIGCNAAHGSDGLDTAAQELALFFPDLQKGIVDQER